MTRALRAALHEPGEALSAEPGCAQTPDVRLPEASIRAVPQREALIQAVPQREALIQAAPQQAA